MHERRAIGGILMERNEIIERVKEIVVELLDVEPAAVTESANFIEDLDADSLGIFELVMAVEEEFGSPIPDTEIEKLTTVGNAVDFILANAQKQD
jgi:acyl carrier protein